LAELTSPTIKSMIESGYDTLVFSVGSNEQHGPCLPVSTDTVLGDTLALAIAEKLGHTLKGPTINIGCSEHHMKFPGTVTLSKSTLQAVVKDYVDSVVRHGFKRVVVIPSHGGNFGPLAGISDELKEMHPGVKIVTYTDLQAFVAVLHETSRNLGITPEESGAHAGESEVSMILWAKGDLVVKENIADATGFMGAFTEEETQKIFEDGIGALSPIGVLGCPKKARKEHGERYIDDLATALVEYIGKQ